MDSRIGYRPRLRTKSLLRKKRLRRIWLCVAAAAIAAIAACNWDSATSRSATTGAAAPILQVALNSKTPATATAGRRIYPYSVIPGGVANRADVVKRVASDKVVAAHYASFDLQKAHPVTVGKARAVHVSYRKGDKIYWTANKVMLAQGETVLSDGTSEIRGRCGNRISDTAQLPVAMNEPTADELDASMNVAPAADDGGLQNASFDLGEPAFGGYGGNGGSSFAGIAAASDAAPAAGRGYAGMPAMPGGAPGGMGFMPTRPVTVSAGPTVALGPASEAAVTVTPDAPATPVFTPDVPATPAVPDLPVTPVTTDLPPIPPEFPVTPSTPLAPATPATPVTPVTPPTPPTPAAPVPPVKPADAEIPEPGTLWLFGASFALLLATRRTRGRAAK